MATFNELFLSCNPSKFFYTVGMISIIVSFIYFLTKRMYKYAGIFLVVNLGLLFLFSYLTGLLCAKYGTKAAWAFVVGLMIVYIGTFVFMYYRKFRSSTLMPYNMTDS